MNKHTITAVIASGALFLSLLAGCQADTGNASSNNVTSSEDTSSAENTFTFRQEPVTVNAFKLDTYISISVYEEIDPSYLNDTLDLCDKYEDMFSMHKEGGMLYSLNEGITDKVPAELGNVIKTALEWSGRSDGAFQISVGSVSGLWDFTSGSHKIPSDSELKEALKTVDDSKITLYPENEEDEASDYIVEMPEGTKIDLGAVAKGYIADKLKENLLSKGIRSAVINLGGNVLCVGDKNNVPFNIGIRKPFADDSDLLLVLELSDSSAVSSGISERYFEENGHIYHHIIDPHTGYPYENELWQTTVISKDSFTGDIMSTLCYCLGVEKALTLCENTPETDLILVKDDLSLVKSDDADEYIK